MTEVGELEFGEGGCVHGGSGLGDAGWRSTVEVLSKALVSIVEVGGIGSGTYGNGGEMSCSIRKDGDEQIIRRRRLCRDRLPIVCCEWQLRGDGGVNVEGRPEREEVGFVDHAAPDAEDAIECRREQDGIRPARTLCKLQGYARPKARRTL